MAVDLGEMIHCSSEVETMISVDADADAVIASGPVVTTLIDVLGVSVSVGGETAFAIIDCLDRFPDYHR